MTETDGVIREEVDRLLPAPGPFAPDWADVVARAMGPRSRHSTRGMTLVIAAVAVAVVCAGIAFGATVWLAHGPDRILTIASGRDWSLVAQRKNGRLCVSYGSPGVAGDGCNLTVRRTLSVFTLAPAGAGRARLIGSVAPNVARIEATVSGKKPLRVRVYPLPAFFGSTLRMFVVEVPHESVLLGPGRPTRVRLTVTAYGRHGRALRRLTFGA